jgi:hypothetical protein
VNAVLAVADMERKDVNFDMIKVCIQKHYHKPLHACSYMHTCKLHYSQIHKLAVQSSTVFSQRAAACIATHCKYIYTTVVVCRQHCMHAYFMGFISLCRYLYIHYRTENRSQLFAAFFTIV